MTDYNYSYSYFPVEKSDEIEDKLSLLRETEIIKRMQHIKPVNKEYVHKTFEVWKKATKESNSFLRTIDGYRSHDFSEYEYRIVSKYQSMDESTLEKEGIIISKEELIKGTELEKKTKLEQDNAWYEYVSRKRNEALRSALLEEKRKHLLYNIMTDNQIKQLEESYRTWKMQEGLLKANKDTLIESRKHIRDLAYVQEKEEDIRSVVRGEIIGGMADIKATTALEQEKKMRIRKAVYDTIIKGGDASLKFLVGSNMIPALQGEILPVLTGNYRVAYGIVYAIMFTIYGVKSYAQFKTTPKAIEKAKSLGIYTYIVGVEQAKRLYDECVEAFYDNDAKRKEEEYKEEIERIYR